VNHISFLGRINLCAGKVEDRRGVSAKGMMGGGLGTIVKVIVVIVLGG